MNFEINILNEIYKMISNVIHNFYLQYRVDDALYRSFDSMGPNMKKAADQIYQLLLAEDKENEIREYYDNVPNRFLRAFVSQCVSIMELGNQKVEGKLLFVRNMENLQREIEIEIDKLQRLRLEFFGVILCVVAPVFCIDFVKQFAVSIKENMSLFFYGKQGFLCDIGLLGIIIIIYIIMRKSAEYKPLRQSRYQLLYAIDRIPIVKKSINNFCDKYATKVERLKRELRNNGNNIRPRHFILRSCIICFTAFIIALGTELYLHKISRDQLLVADISQVELLTSAAKENQYEQMAKVIEKYTKKYVLKTNKRSLENNSVNEKKLINLLQEEGDFYNTTINKALAVEILRRVRAYQKEHYSLVDLLLCLLLSIIAYYLPELILKYTSTVSRDAMEDEVNQFNAIIFMLMHVESMTVKQILEQMEAFAVIFKQSLRICINDYGSSDLDALEELKNREPYEPFQRIVDNLIRCDDMPVHQAFHEIDVEREGYITKRKLSNEISIKKRVIRAYLLAAIPFLLLFAYGIVPTLLSSINEINGMLNELEVSAW